MQPKQEAQAVDEENWVKYIDGYHNHQWISLEVDKIEFNPARRHGRQALPQQSLGKDGCGAVRPGERSLPLFLPLFW